MIKLINILISDFICLIPFVNVIIYWIFEQKINDRLSAVFFLLSISFMFIGIIFKSRKCCCPYCGAGKNIFWDEHGYMSSLIRHRGTFICPDCNQIVRVT